MLQIVNTINSYLSDYILVFLFGGCRPLVYSQKQNVFRGTFGKV